MNYEIQKVLGKNPKTRNKANPPILHHVVENKSRKRNDLPNFMESGWSNQEISSYATANPSSISTSKGASKNKTNNLEEEADKAAARISNGKSVGKVSKGGGQMAKVQASAEGKHITSPGVKKQIASSRSSGQPLQSGIRSEMEKGFNADFGGVRVHSGHHATQMTRSMGAKAFAYGNDIYFNQAHSNTNSREGKKLLAHELTHTIQQGEKNQQIQKSALATVNKGSKQLTIASHFIFYGEQATDAIASAATTEIQAMWNDANGTVDVDGETLKVKFKISYDVCTEEGATDEAKSNTSAKVNFVRIGEKNIVSRSFMQLLGNAGHWLNSDGLGSSTTAPHEYGHSIGLSHSVGDLRGIGQPGIMAARGTMVDEEYRYGNWKDSGYEGINPSTRKVIPDDINDLGLQGYDFSSGSSAIGTATNVIYDAFGNRV
jgi:hypothetical protein